VSFNLTQRVPLVPVMDGVDCVPTYFITGGLVFVPLTLPFLEHAYGGRECSAPLAIHRAACVVQLGSTGMQVCACCAAASCALAGRDSRLLASTCAHHLVDLGGGGGPRVQVPPGASTVRCPS
jgi:PDZ domain